MALITKTDVKLVLTQIGSDTAYDSLLDAICTRVQAIIELYLGFTFAAYTSATTKVVYGNGTPWLPLPPFEPGSVTSVVVEVASGTPAAITGWAEEGTGSSLYITGNPPYSGGWRENVRYVVTADWGLGPTWPDALKEVAVELAANIFEESKTGHFSDIKGVQGEGGAVAVGYEGALTKRQRLILNKIKQQYSGGVLVA